MSAIFFQVLREELLKQINDDKSKWPIAFYTSALAAFRFQGREARFNTRNHDFAVFLRGAINSIYNERINLEEKKTQTILITQDLNVSRKMRDDMEQFALTGSNLFQDDLGNLEKLNNISVCLAALFLSSGSLASPKDAYHLEFSLQRMLALEFFDSVFQGLGIEMGKIRHQGYHVLYAKDGETISDFLLHSKAHKSLLKFEALRVEKDLLNQVNRVVNCDSANAQRVANSSARQRSAIKKIISHNKLKALPEKLQETAMLRMENPELSLTELGEKLNPPMGKSGINHRMQKLIKLAQELN